MNEPRDYATPRSPNDGDRPDPPCWPAIGVLAIVAVGLIAAGMWWPL